MEYACCNLAYTLWQRIQISLMIIPEVDVRNEKTAKKIQEINYVNFRSKLPKPI